MAYKYFNKKQINNCTDTDPIEEVVENFISKQKKQVSFNDHIEEFLPYNNISYRDTNDILNEDLDKIVDTLLNENTLKEKYISNDCIRTNIADEDRNKMFIELEDEIERQYSTINKDGLYGVDIPMMNNTILNTKDIRSSDLNPVINPNVYNVVSDDNSTIWEQYDKVTTNNYKEYSGLNNLNDRFEIDGYELNGKESYGSSKFDNFMTI
jgi:hypothetical protein